MTAAAVQFQGTRGRELPVLLLSAGLLLVVGLVLIASASMDVAADHYGNSFHFDAPDDFRGRRLPGWSGGR